jgi:hypothetical protein
MGVWRIRWEGVRLQRLIRCCGGSLGCEIFPIDSLDSHQSRHTDHDISEPRQGHIPGKARLQ